MPAAGSGSRFGADAPKQYAPLEGRTVIEWALAPFLADVRCAHIVVALARADAAWEQVAARLGARGSILTAIGGGGARSPSVRPPPPGAAGGRAGGERGAVRGAGRPPPRAAGTARPP